jgi:hypothetical protein
MQMYLVKGNFINIDSIINSYTVVTGCGMLTVVVIVTSRTVRYPIEVLCFDF